MKDYSSRIDAYFRRLKDVLDLVSREEISTFMNLLVEARDHDRQILIMGNGGSAATASHWVCDFNKGLSYGKTRRFRFIALNDNQPTLLAYANDVGYEFCFTEILKNYLRPGDLVVGISGSGNSRSIINAVEFANTAGGITVGLSGFDGGLLKRTARYGIHIPVDDMQITEDLHMILDHMMYSVLGRDDDSRP